ncbi:MAG: Holliday junction resolvase RuvX [Cyanobacteria bacterium SID2]|nr:Holliday junction resolvase RuvX [Cyanobacteria bacterium SID2]MBP0005833.1 Holliday junction resolvase RuvX [Cyanobacteria bacterium SBC]
MTENPSEPYTLGFDPGRDKCGVALVRGSKTLLENTVVSSELAIETLRSICQRYPVTTLVIGDRTTSQHWQHQITAALPHCSIVRVDEHNSTLEARDRYWTMYPPRGLSRIIPAGMRVPPRPIDDIVAILLIERYLSRS